MKRISSAYYVWLTLLGSSAAFALSNTEVTPPTDIAWRRVHYGDLDLTHDAGVAALYSRIRAAARTVCPMERAWADKWLERAETCRFQAVARAVAEVNSPSLTSYYDAQVNHR